MQYVLIVLGGISLSGLIGAAIASTRGQAVPGFLFGALLGPIGWAICFFTSDVRPKCPECKGVVISGARRCKNCGSEILRGPARRRSLGSAVLFAIAAVGLCLLLILAIPLAVRLSH